ncbi:MULTISPECIES: phage exclusion protein Lit family protein [unclassified Bradyrhizobium]|uniref:phage exclusion protein Lit family protein n=1 Tax=unclassified Bradyrhizobium TaxID=2631580 RepID=UPI0029162CF8|nr:MULTISPECIES: phage exclusion protein Lit family protein [unclassified Bradyrhizobium]
MSLGALFMAYQPPIRAMFERIATENGLVGDKAAKLEFTEGAGSMLFRSIPSERLVKLDWRGIASMWAMSQAASRLMPAMFKARRAGIERLAIKEDTTEELGMNFIGYARAMCVPQQWRWNTYYPRPDPNSASEDVRLGDRFFFQALDWIIRHEVAHIVLGHTDQAWTDDQSRMEERDADRHATEGLRKNLAPDPNRPPGSAASENELELERRAVAVGLGLVWVAIYEETGGKPSTKYPPVADRLSRSLDQFGRAPDGFATEILSDFIKSWIDPVGVWPALPAAEATAQAAFDEACRRLDGYISSERQKPQNE